MNSVAEMELPHSEPNAPAVRADAPEKPLRDPPNLLEAVVSCQTKLVAAGVPVLAVPMCTASTNGAITAEQKQETTNTGADQSPTAAAGKLPSS